MAKAKNQVKNNKEVKCCSGSVKHHIAPVAILLLAVLWLLSDLGIMMNNIPWFPIIVIVAIIGKMMYYHSLKR